jgi:hypothetical protein
MTADYTDDCLATDGYEYTHSDLLWHLATLVGIAWLCGLLVGVWVAMGRL